jgi:hypothetical protein
MHEHARTGRVQPPRDGGADAARAPGDKGRFAGQRLIHECLEF